MIFYYLIDFVFSIAEKIVLNFDTVSFNDILGGAQFIANLFKYANVLFPLKELTPVALAYSAWYLLRLRLSILGFVKKYIPIA